MPRYEFTMQRLYLRTSINSGARIELDKSHANYLVNVLRMGPGDAVLVFNGHDGEWKAEIAEATRRHVTLAIVEQTRPQTPLPDLHYLFAPLKHARLDYMVQKAVEMGAGVLQPVLTQHTQASRVNLERMEGNVVEAAEQCGILAVPEVREPVALANLIERYPTYEPGRRLIFCDEASDGLNPIPALADLSQGPLAVLIGPEGGFSRDERLVLKAQKFVTPIPLGPRILRADTAAVAALAVVQAVIGDWS
ncbi:16S rRNA (uracil(1498)-N(3))-methyltransferase [Rhodobium gokarnense]|uniref:Ribosomal RNA small subunit methyltransferase E n=1 Tax=Rhodobium gokarnense TaxID=364296 RepID=A0ABT3HCH2_9HYPH|nr:16S rRNA (uracil(1498)-N(3))-methyltransferase [Rhodobium gokarnense]MCW2308090.1 16S rRNA (uracil1498-N3)-methyltransferase [Rhodobium gokarnense]